MNQNIILILSAVVLLILCIPNLLFKSPIKGKKDKILLIHGMVFLFLLVLVYHFLIIDVVNESFQDSVCELTRAALSDVSDIYNLKKDLLNSNDLKLECLNKDQFKNLNLNNLNKSKYKDIPEKYIDFLQIDKITNINNLANFETEQIRSFLPIQIDSLKEDRLKQMTLYTLEKLHPIWWCFTNTQLNSLKHIIKKIKVYCDKNCNPNISIFFLSKINIVLSNFTTAQLNYLITNNIINITKNSKELNTVLSYKGQRGNELIINFSKITDNMLPSIKVANIQSLPASFIRNIGKQIVNLTPTQLKALSKSQVRAINNINDLNDKIQYIKAEYLTPNQLISSTTGYLLNYISTTSLNNFSINNIYALRKVEIDAFDCTRLKILYDRAIFLGMNESDIQLSNISSAILKSNCKAPI